jgi:hypothetical protein
MGCLLAEAATRGVAVLFLEQEMLNETLRGYLPYPSVSVVGV